MKIKFSLILHKNSTKVFDFFFICRYNTETKNKLKGERMLKKLSLAAVIAMGAMSVASATPLTEAIKNVNLSGMLRIRYYNVKTEDTNSMWRTNGIFIFTVPVDENIKFVFRNSTQTYIKHTESNDGRVDASTVDSTMVNNLLFMKYSNGGLNLMAGKLPVATPITSVDPATPSHGAGAIASYNLGNGFTVAAAYVEALKHASPYSPEWAESPKINSDTYDYAGNVINNDVYALAGMYKGDGVDAQLWYFKVENLLKHDVILSANVDISQLANLDGVKLGVHFDYANSKLDDTAIDAVGAKLAGTSIDTAYENGDYDTGNKAFYNINVEAGMDMADVRVGYAKTNKKIGVIDLSVDSPLANSQAATYNDYDIANYTDTHMYYADVTFKPMDKVSATLAYSHIKNKVVDDKNKDWTAKVTYSYNKKLSFEALYDHTKWDSDKDATKTVRIEAKYKF